MIESILSGLSSVKKYSANRWQASCPAHDDSNPSMSITLGKGKVLFHCHAGCKQEDVIEALKELGLWPNGNRMPAVETRYSYQKPNGTHAYDIVRIERPGQKKTFVLDPPKYPDKYLYKLPKVLKSRSVIVVEGEKDVRTVERLGLVGTSNPFGVGNWRTEFAKCLRGKRVVVIPDNDKAGIEHGEHICRSLTGLAEVVKFVRLPVGEKGDLTDWAAGRDNAKEELLELIKRTPEFGCRPPEELIRVSEVTAREVEFLWHPYIPIGKFTLIDGDPGVGKSWLTQAIATGVSRGEGIPSRYEEPANVLLLSTEDDVEDTIRPRLDSMGADVSRIYAVNEYFAFNDAGREKLRALIRATKARAVFIDPLVAYFGSRLDMNKANETRSVMAALGLIAEEFQCAMVGIRHLRKEAGKAGKALYRGTGSIDIVGAARSALMVVEDQENRGIREIWHTKCNVAAKGEKLYYTIVNARFFWLLGDKMQSPGGDYDYLEDGPFLEEVV